MEIRSAENRTNQKHEKVTSKVLEFTWVLMQTIKSIWRELKSPKQPGNGLKSNWIYQYRDSSSSCWPNYKVAHKVMKDFKAVESCVNNLNFKINLLKFIYKPALKIQKDKRIWVNLNEINNREEIKGNIGEVGGSVWNFGSTQQDSFPFLKNF